MASESFPRTSDSNPTRARRTQDAEAFQVVLERLYLPNRLCHPIRSVATCLDINAEYRRFTFDCVIIAADVERAIDKALDNDKESLDRFWEWFVLPEAGIEPPILTPEQSKLYRSIQQRCGAEFRRRKLWPIHRYLGLPERALHILEAA
jgi:hypothetical protein